jgi:hypothetical protein
VGEHTIKELPNLDKATFYNDKDSIYIRVTYMPEYGGYRVTMFNEITAEEGSEHIDNVVKLFVLARGLAEIALVDPQYAFEVGYNVQASDAIDLAEGLTDDEKELLKNVKGTA